VGYLLEAYQFACQLNMVPSYLATQLPCWLGRWF